jgi:hypothetical protein
MPDIDFGLGANTPTGDLFLGAIVKLKGQLGVLEGGVSPSGPTLRLGQQDGNYHYYTGADYARDKGRMVSIRHDGLNAQGQFNAYIDFPQTEGGIGGYDENGYVNSYFAGQSQVRYSFPFFWARTGVYTIKYPAGMTCKQGLANGYILGPEYAIDATTVGRKLTVNQHYYNAGDITFEGIPTGKTATTMGLRPSITWDADANPERLATDEVVASHAVLKSKVWRAMDARQVNGNLDRYTMTSTQNYFEMSIDLMIDFCNLSNQDLWLNFPVYQTDELIRFELDKIATRLNPNLQLFIEYVNEPWNTASIFGPHGEEMTYLGYNAGFATSTTSAGATPLNPPLIRTGDTFATYSNPIPKRNFSAGTVVAGNRYGNGVGMWKALQNITSGDTNAALPATTNAYWQLLANAGQGVNAKQRWVSFRTAQITAIAKAAYNAVGRSTASILPVINWQAVASFSFAQVAFDFDNNYNVFKVYATAPYWGGPMGNYTGNHFGTWNADTKALFLADQAACLDAYFANVNTDINATLDRQASRKTELAAYVAAKGLPADTIKLAAYEINCHTQFDESFNNWPDTAKRNALQYALTRDPRFGDATAYFINEYRRRIGGDAVWYGRCGHKSPWLSQYDELDRTSVVMAALIENS